MSCRLHIHLCYLAGISLGMLIVGANGLTIAFGAGLLVFLISALEVPVFVLRPRIVLPFLPPKEDKP